MLVKSVQTFLSILLVLLAGISVSAQVDASMSSPSDRRKPNEQEVKSISEMLIKQRLLKEKKDHEEMLKRGEEAVALSEQLEETFEQKSFLSDRDNHKLTDLEKLVTKIRKELGGDEVDDDVFVSNSETKPSTLKEAFTFLQSTTVKLVDELKKTTRFSISAAAIESSNAVLKLVRFLKLKR